MAAISVVAARVGILRPLTAEIRSYVAAAALTKGAAVYIKTDGKIDLCDANAAGCKQFRGIALQSVGAGQIVDVLHEGEVAGFDVSSMNVDAPVYVNDTAGVLDTTASVTTTVVAGRVVMLTDGPTNTKVIRITTRWSQDWA